MKFSRGSAFFFLLFAEWAQADVLVRYDAGSSGSPVSPTNYIYTNFSFGGPWRMVLTSATGITNAAVTNDLGSGFNAWNVSDNTTASGSVSFTNPIPADIDDEATNAGWTLRARVRMVSDFGGGSDACFVEYGRGTNAPRYLIFFGLDGGNNLTVQLQGLATRTLTTNGQGNAAYHLHEIVYQGGTASYYFDGQLITNNWAGFGTASSGDGVRFGSGATAGKGSVNYNLVEWEIHATKPTVTTLAPSNLLAYAATVAGNVNWSGLPGFVWFEWGATTNYGGSILLQFASSTNSTAFFESLTGLSSGNTYHFRCGAQNDLGITYGDDGVFTTPSTFPASTLPVATLEPRQATLSGSMNPSGLLGTGRFQWGTTTNYVNQTAPQNMGSGTSEINITQLLTNLTPGTTYHYRLYASNTQDTVFGQDQSFTTPVVFIVSNLQNSGAGSLRQSIANALAGETITFGVTGTVVLASELVFAKNLTITGSTPGLVAVSGANAVRVMSVNNSVTVNISGLTIRNGRAPIGANSASTNNPGQSGGDGGGIFNRGTLTLSNCVIIANASGTGGGGFSGDDTSSNGGPGGDGGGIYNIGQLTMTACTVRQNTSGTGGLGPNGTDAGNKPGGGNGDGGDAGSGGSGGNGGGIYNGGTLILDNCTLSMNVAGRGGDGGQGGEANVGMMTYVPGISGLGGSGGDGSAIYNIGALTLRNVTISGNTAGRGGDGGDGARMSSPAGIPGAGANAGNGGRGAIYNNGSMGLGACTVSQNTSGLGGTGGNGQGGPAGNGGNGGDAGGILNAAAGSAAHLQSTIVALNINNSGGAGGTPNGNLGLIGFAPDLKGTFTSDGHNLVGKDDGSASFIIAPGATGDQIGSLLFPINPLLGPLTNRGGLTQTRSLLTGSPARDAGDDALTGLLSGDQRGYARLSGAHVDIGAFEVQVVTTNDRPWLTNPVKLGNTFQFSFTNVPGAEFTVLTTTNLALPLSNWTLATLAEIAPGQFQFTDTTGATNRFYLVRWP